MLSKSSCTLPTNTCCVCINIDEWADIPDFVSSKAPSTKFILITGQPPQCHVQQLRTSVWAPIHPAKVCLISCPSSYYHNLQHPCILASNDITDPNTEMYWYSWVLEHLHLGSHKIQDEWWIPEPAWTGNVTESALSIWLPNVRTRICGTWTWTWTNLYSVLQDTEHKLSLRWLVPQAALIYNDSQKTSIPCNQHSAFSKSLLGTAAYRWTHIAALH